MSERAAPVRTPRRLLRRCAPVLDAPVRGGETHARTIWLATRPPVPTAGGTR